MDKLDVSLMENRRLNIMNGLMVMVDLNYKLTKTCALA